MTTDHERADRALVENVTASIVRLPLPLPMQDLREVNAYAILGDDGVTLVDPGWADEPSEGVLLDALSQLGFEPGDVRRIVVTHVHWDHYTRAILWQRRYGTTVMVGRPERPSIEQYDEATGSYPVQVTYLRKAGAPGLAQLVEDLPLEPYERDAPFSFPDVWLDDGDEIDCEGITLVARSTPGHTRGHMVYLDQQSGVTFTGDHVLPRITPSIGLERAPVPLPLRSYLGSLRLLLDVPDASMLPAHGAVTSSVQVRVRELLEHHRVRLELVHDLVAAGFDTAYQVARQMSWTRHGRFIDDLGTVHGMVAILEVVAHLELLAIREQLTAQDVGAVTHYAIA